MRKFGKESTAPVEGADRESGKGWLQNHGALAVCIVVILALIMRTVFSYGVSADSDFALSGGSDAQYHLHVVESILDGSFIIGSDAAINYPLGGLNVNPPLYDFIAAAVGSVTSASTALAVLAPIFGALACIPVYLIGKELGGVKTGFVASLIYALLALPISSTVISNGTEYGFTAFLVGFFTLALIKVVRKVNSEELAMKELVIAGVLLGLIALSWNGFRVLLVLLILIMVIQLVLDRFNSKDFSVPLYSYSIVMLIGVVIGALYYIPAGLWDAVFSGPVLITVIAVVFGFIFKALQSKPWIITIPGLVIAFAVIAIVLYFVVPDLGTALIFGNSAYTNDIMSELVSTGVTVSKMSSYYGWLLMWMPVILGIWEFYVYAKKDRSHAQLALTMWLLVLWFFAWTSYGTAAVVGSVFAVSSAIVLIKVLKRADLGAWVKNMKTAGFPGCFRKLIKPLPFLSVLIATFLVIIPGALYAVDAGISYNEDYGYPCYGNTQFTIEAGESYPVTYVYDDLTNEDSAVVTWIDYSTDVAALGFNAVNDKYGNGASAVAQIYLANGAAGATAAQIMRIIQANEDTNFASAFSGNAAVYSAIKSYIDDPDKAIEEILGDSETYGSVSSDINDENAVYLASIHAITDAMGTSDIMKAYNSVCNIADEKIGYYIIDGSMVPFVYGDGNSLSTMAYFAGYSTDSYGAASQFYSYITYYSNYYPATATNALYETFLWKALIGPSPSEAGYSSSFSYLYDLTTSDGTVKAMPGYGLAGYSIASWYLKYNNDPKAATSDDNWEYMSYAEAISKQQKDGGVINYLSSIILLQYDGVSASTQTGKLVNEDNQPLAGITVQVTHFDERFGANVVYSETATNESGNYTAMLPSNTSNVVYKSGDVKLEYTADASTITVQSAKIDGIVAVNGQKVESPDYLYVLKMDGKQYTIETVDGIIDSAKAVDSEGKSVLLIPGKYSYELRDSSAASVGSGSITLYAGQNSGLTVSPTSYTITATVTDIYGKNVEDGQVVATNSSTGDKYEANIVEGQAVVSVPSGTYTVGLKGGYTTTNTTSLSVTSNRTVSITAYASDSVEVQNEVALSIYGGSYSTTPFKGSVEIPTSIVSEKPVFTIYGANTSSVYLGVYDGSGKIDVVGATAYAVTGKIGASGTVTFINDEGAIVNASADSNGEFNALLPAGQYLIVATNGSDKAYIAKETIDGDKDFGSITLVDGRKITETFQYASGSSKSNLAIPFTNVEMTFTYDSKDWSIPALTDTSGKTEFIIPDDASDIKVIINGGSVDNGVFEYSEMTSEFDAGTSDSSKTVTIPRDNVKKLTITLDEEYTVTFDPYSTGDDVKVEGETTVELAPGQYTATIDAETGYYFDGTVYVYPGKAELIGFDPVKVFGVEIVKGSTDKLTITPTQVHEEDGIYYFEYDTQYDVTSESSDGKKVQYATINEPTPAKIDVTTSETNTIKVFTGVIADGNGTVSYYDAVNNDDVVINADVKSGEFEIKLPKSVIAATFSAELTKTISSQDFGYKGSVPIDDLKDEMTVNIPVFTDANVVEHSSDIDAAILNAVFDNGKATVEVQVYNNTDYDKTVAITAGSAWLLDEAMIMAVQANSSEVVTITGTYEPNSVGIGSTGMSIIVSDYNGSSSKTVRIVDGEVKNGSSSVTFKTAADSNNKDKLSGNAYLYALTFQTGAGSSTVTINATVSGNYELLLMSEDGELVKSNGETFVLAPESNNVVYVEVMSSTGNLTSAPSITVQTDYGTKTISSSTIDIEVDSIDIDADDAVEKKSGIPVGIWFLFGVSIILLILIVWMGSKRGVFSRR